jgi:hypothetical protein
MRLLEMNTTKQQCRQLLKTSAENLSALCGATVNKKERYLIYRALLNIRLAVSCLESTKPRKTPSAPRQREPEPEGSGITITINPDGTSTSKPFGPPINHGAWYVDYCRRNGEPLAPEMELLFIRAGEAMAASELAEREGKPVAKPKGSQPKSKKPHRRK